MFAPITLSDRITARGDRGEHQLRAAGADAMRVALARIGAEFDESAKIARFKARVANFIRLGAGHPTVRARYGRRVALLRGQSIDAACQLVDRWLREERRTFEIARVFGRGHPLALEVLTELRLLLRLCRRSEYSKYFSGIVQFTIGEAA